MSFFGDAVAAKVAAQTDELLRSEITRYLGQDFTAEDVRARCVIHVYSDGVQEVVIDGEPRLRMGALGFRTVIREGGVHMITASRTIKHI